MPDAAERLVNLALLLAARPGVSADDIRSAGIGYPDGQAEATFLRMFERDKDTLRSLGFVIESRLGDDVERYSLDASASFARPVELSAEERSAIRTVAAALASDPGFPHTADLIHALGKTGAGLGVRHTAASRLADEAPEKQAAAARTFASAIRARKRVTFTYTNSRGERRRRTVDPYGTFVSDGRWYAAGLDHDRSEVRVFALVRAEDAEVNAASPHTPDFEVPDGFSVGAEAALPFEFGAAAGAEATVRIRAEDAWRAARATRGRGALTESADGSLEWRVPMGDARSLASWLVAEGPGFVPLGPPELVTAFRIGLAEVIGLHAGER